MFDSKLKEFKMCESKMNRVQNARLANDQFKPLWNSLQWKHKKKFRTKAIQEWKNNAKLKSCAKSSIESVSLIKPCRESMERKSKSKVIEWLKFAGFFHRISSFI